MTLAGWKHEIELAFWARKFPLAKNVHDKRCQRNRPLTRPGFRRAECLVLVRALANVKFAFYKVNIRPAEATQFRCAKLNRIDASEAVAEHLRRLPDRPLIACRADALIVIVFHPHSLRCFEHRPLPWSCSGSRRGCHAANFRRRASVQRSNVRIRLAGHRWLETGHILFGTA